MNVFFNSFFPKPDKRQFNDSKDSNELLKKDIEKLDDGAQTILESAMSNTDHVIDVNTKSPSQNGMDDVKKKVQHLPRLVVCITETVKANRATSVIQDRYLSMYEPLMDRQLVCKNLIFDGEFISHDERAKCNIGKFIDKNTIELHDNFEIEIVSLGKFRDIAIGVVQRYDTYNPLGLEDGVYGYHSEGFVHTNGRVGCWNFGDSWRVGDRIRCIIRLGLNTSYSPQQLVSFTRNGAVIHEDWMPSGNYRFAIVIGYQGGMIRVTNLPAK